ncbi:hypothetical protein, partial [Dickeya solani]|uniref:hypothetical protein n=1 Tax=Dickeya solani TaxID=1089444 RepID=UPI0022A7EF27
RLNYRTALCSVSEVHTTVRHRLRQRFLSLTASVCLHFQRSAAVVIKGYKLSYATGNCRPFS